MVLCPIGLPDFNRKRHLNKIIEEDIGINIEFTVYDVIDCWEKRWSRVPSIKELSKVIASNPALDSYKSKVRGCVVYCWDGVKDLTLFITDTDEDIVKYREYRMGEKKFKE